MRLVDLEAVKRKLRLRKWSDLLHENSLFLICIIQFKPSETSWGSYVLVVDHHMTRKIAFENIETALIVIDR